MVILVSHRARSTSARYALCPGAALARETVHTRTHRRVARGRASASCPLSPDLYFVIVFDTTSGPVRIRSSGPLVPCPSTIVRLELRIVTYKRGSCETLRLLMWWYLGSMTYNLYSENIVLKFFSKCRTSRPNIKHKNLLFCLILVGVWIHVVVSLSIVDLNSVSTLESSFTMLEDHGLIIQVSTRQRQPSIDNADGFLFFVHLKFWNIENPAIVKFSVLSWTNCVSNLY